MKRVFEVNKDPIFGWLKNKENFRVDEPIEPL